MCVCVCVWFDSHYIMQESIRTNWKNEKPKIAIYLTQITTAAVWFVGTVLLVTRIGIIAGAFTFASMSGSWSKAMIAAGGRISFAVVFLRKFCGFCLCVSTIRIPNEIIILHTYID